MLVVCLRIMSSSSNKKKTGRRRATSPLYVSAGYIVQRTRTNPFTSCASYIKTAATARQRTFTKEYTKKVEYRTISQLTCKVHVVLGLLSEHTQRFLLNEMLRTSTQKKKSVLTNLISSGNHTIHHQNFHKFKSTFPTFLTDGS